MGFRQEGALWDYVFKEGKRHDMIIMSMLLAGVRSAEEALRRTVILPQAVMSINSGRHFAVNADRDNRQPASGG